MSHGDDEPVARAVGAGSAAAVHAPAVALPRTSFASRILSSVTTGPQRYRLMKYWRPKKQISSNLPPRLSKYCGRHGDTWLLSRAPCHGRAGAEAPREKKNALRLRLLGRGGRVNVLSHLKAPDQ